VPAQAWGPFGLAASYNTASCREAIRRSNFSRWLRTSPEKTWLNTLILLPAHSGLATTVRYVRNQKAGSMMMYAGGLEASLGTDISTFPIRKIRQMKHQIVVYYPPRSPKKNGIGADEFVLTVVREPVDRFIAGYLEILNRSKIQGGRFWGMRRFDAIARLEHLEEDMAKIRQAVRRRPDMLNASQRSRFFGLEHHSHVREPCADVDLKDPELMRKLCSALEVDYICFQYPPPEICRALFPRYAQVARRAAAVTAEPAGTEIASALTSPTFAETAAAFSARRGGWCVLALAAATGALLRTGLWE